MENSDPRPIYGVTAEAVPVVIMAFELGQQNFRIRLGRGIGWAPERFKTREAVLKKLLNMKSYGIAEAKMCKAICTQNP